MGVSVMYNAIPIESSLYKRIQTEKALCILVNSLTIYGGGLFSFFDLDAEETQEILGHVVENSPDVFGSQAEADQIISDFRSEIMAARQAYPGIENRTALIEKSFDDIEKCLAQAFLQRRIEQADEWALKLLTGDRSLAPNLLAPEDNPIDMISFELVKEGSLILRSVEPDALRSDAPHWREWGLEHLKAWRELYLVGSENKEAILVSSG